MPEPLSPKIGFGMKVATNPCCRYHLDDVFVDLKFVSHPNQGVVAKVNFALPCCRNFVVVNFAGTPAFSNASTIFDRTSWSVSEGGTGK